MYRKNSILFFFLFLFFSCEKDIKIDLPQSQGKLVVEGWIEQGRGAKILLSMSAPFFAETDSATLRGYSVTKAKVTLFSNGESEILTLKPNDVYFPPYYYYSYNIKGKLNNEYSLEIRNAGYIYTAKTTIPGLIKPDSVWFQLSENSDTLGRLMVKFTDDASERNYYRTLVKRFGKDKRFIPTFTSVFSDEAFNGKQIEIPLTRGNSSILDIDQTRFFSVGDTIILKFCSVDKNHYEFWNTIQGQNLNAANPFSVSNTDVKGNIENALGVWGGYAVAYDTVIAK